MRLDVGLLAAARMRAGLTVAEVAKKAGISEAAAYRAFRTGASGVKVARAIAEALRLGLPKLWVQPAVLSVQGGANAGEGRP